MIYTLMTNNYKNLTVEERTYFLLSELQKNNKKYSRMSAPTQVKFCIKQLQYLEKKKRQKMKFEHEDLHPQRLKIYFCLILKKR